MGEEIKRQKEQLERDWGEMDQTLCFASPERRMISPLSEEESQDSLERGA